MTNHVFDSTEQTFAHDVIQASMQQPVLVDFWATWCQPCQVLKPLLKRVVESYNGEVLLAYVDADVEQNLAAQFGIRSLPTVMLIKEGEVIDQFMGTQPESTIRAMIDKHILRESDVMLHQAMSLLEQGHEVEALELLRLAHELDPKNSAVLLTLARLAAHAGRTDDALSLLNSIPDNAAEAHMARELKAQIHFSRQAEQAGDVDTLLARIESDPADCEAREKLAIVWVNQGCYEEALQGYLDIMQRDRNYNDGAGRKGMIQIFELLGDAHPLTLPYRRKMFGMLH
ncbi:MAG: co-chaperone YbbN [Halothiobacillaceae bacterium]|nr:co-chaperone YbbN [Halothiobacillaceae bacterium]